MRAPIVDRGPGDEHQHSLFDSPAVCPQPDCLTSRRNLCKWEADKAAGDPVSRQRPAGCLTAHDPKTDPFPDGF